MFIFGKLCQLITPTRMLYCSYKVITAENEKIIDTSTTTLSFIYAQSFRRRLWVKNISKYFRTELNIKVFYSPETICELLTFLVQTNKDRSLLTVRGYSRNPVNMVFTKFFHLKFKFNPRQPSVLVWIGTKHLIKR